VVSMLIIPDIHARNDVPNEHLEWAGNLIIDKKPDYVVSLADLFDFPSLSSWDKGKMAAENRRYAYDIDAGVKAQERLFKPLTDYNRARKHKYQPTRIFTMGNHEHRLFRAINDDAKLEFTIDPEDMQLYSFWDEIVPFKESTEVGGMFLSHYFPNGLMDKAISGKTVGAALIAKMHRSAAQGHSHVLNMHTEAGVDGNRMWGLSCGWWGHETQVEDYVSKTIQKTWFRCLIYLHNLENGNCDPEVFSMERVKELYA